MGILNITPDSFFDGGLYASPKAALARALKMQDEGADIVDVGARSTKPGHEDITAAEELSRLLPVLRGLKGNLRVPVSVDTFDPIVAEAALQEGAVVINDVSGRVSPEMAEIIKSYGAGWVIMHTGFENGGLAENMSSIEMRSAGGREDIITDVRRFFEQSLKKTDGYGILRGNICLDPGLGFGKSYEEHLRLVKSVNEYKIPGVALLIGASRKRFTGGGLYETIAAHTAAILGGADIIRVHDVAENVSAAKMAGEIRWIK